MAQIWIAGKTSRRISGFVTLSTRIPPLVTLTNPRNTHCHKRRRVHVFLAAIFGTVHLRAERKMTT